MPCRVYDDDEIRHQQATEIADQRQKLKKVEAMLCGILTTLTDTTQFGAGNDEWFDTFLDRLDYAEMGVTREELLAWWDDHLEKDRRRREREREAAAEQERERQEEQERNRLIEGAKSKLSTAEKKALGIK